MRIKNSASYKKGRSAGDTKLVLNQPGNVDAVRRVARAAPQQPPEAKAYEISFTTTIDNSGTNIVDTCAIAQGTAFNQRVGLQIQPLVLDIQCSALANASTVASTAFRMLVVQSMGSEVSTPAIDEIINNIAGNCTLGDVWKLFQYPPQSKALKLLHDETFVNTKYGGLGDLVQFKRRVDLRGCRSVDYMGSSTAISDNAGGRIYVFSFLHLQPLRHQIAESFWIVKQKLNHFFIIFYAPISVFPHYPAVKGIKNIFICQLSKQIHHVCVGGEGAV